jgi:SAM-dependent methyltransferase
VADPAANEMEMQPTIRALQLHSSAVCFELGCGTGRYTVHIAPQCASFLAIDFSGESLRILARKLDGRSHIGLVQADVTRLRLAPHAFDQGLSTLVSNLPTAGAREAMYRLAAEALKPQGRFVFGVHYHGLFQRIRGVPKEGAYTEGGIYRCNFRRREIAAEVRAHYRDVDVLPVQIPVPLGRRLGLPVVRISLLFGRIPLIRQTANLLLVTASRPRTAAAVVPDLSARRSGGDAMAAAPQ